MSRLQKTDSIRLQLQAADQESLPSFITEYETDERAGVQKMVQQARNRLLAIEKEIMEFQERCRYEMEYEAMPYVCGIDEAGRGPLAGPVVAAAVVLPKDCKIYGINDSKKIPEAKREELFEIICREAIAVGVGMSGPQRIDEINILQATYEAMREALSKLTIKPDILLNDAVTIPGVLIRQVPIIKGDAKSISIGAASIIAKVTRDRLMKQYDEVLPEYGFARHKGYGSKMHIEAIRQFGPSPIHRASFIGNFIDH